MAKKYKYVKNALYTEDATLRKLKTVFEDKMMFLTRGGVASDVRERFMDVNFETLRNIAHRLSIANMCINCREQQMMPFLKPAKEIGDTGFVVTKKSHTSRQFRGKDKKADMLMDMVEQTGFVYDDKREDDFIDFGKMLMREVLVIDQIAIELQRNRRGEIGAFWLIDGATISRCFEEGFEGNRDIAFVQEVDGQIEAVYSKEDLIFDYMFKRADLRYRGYGYSLLEQSIDLITTLVLGISYNRDLFIKDKIPKGFIALQGEANDETIEAVGRYWYMAMSGAGGRFTIPIIPSGKEGVSMDFKTMGQSNRDMEYNKLMLFFLSLFAGVFGIDLAELGIKTDNTQQVLGENIEGRIRYSKDRGLNALLSFLSGIMNKIIRKIDQEYVFSFIGLDPEDDIKKYEIAAKAIASSRTPNEIRKEDGLDEKDSPEYNDIINPTLLQFKQFYKGIEQQEQAEQGQEEGAENEEENEWGEEPEKGPEKEGEEEMEKALKSLEDHLDKLKKAGYEPEIMGYIESV